MWLRLSDWVHTLPWRVATKFAVAFTGGSLLALALVVAGLSLHERRELEHSAHADLRSQGDALSRLLGEVWEREGEARAMEMLRAADAVNGDVDLRVEGSGQDEAPPRAGPHVTARVSIRTSTGAERVLVLEKPTPALEATITEAVEAFLLAGVPLALFSTFAAYALGEWLIGAPLRRVASRTRRIGEGDLDDELVVRGSAEISMLKRAVNAMSEDLRRADERARDEERRRLDAVERLRHADRLTTVGTLAAGIAHELGTPLNVILLEARSLGRASADTERVERGAQLIRNQAVRVTMIVRQLLDFARRKQPTRTLEDAYVVVASAASLVSSLARARHCTVDVEAPEGSISFRVDPAGIQQILTNLFVNAFDAMPGGGRVLARIERAARAMPRGHHEQTWVRVEVEDEGTGLDEETRARIFEPFFTTKEVGSGTGLGLSVALGIAEDHGGFIDVRPAPSGGCIFSLYLPDDTSRHAAASDAASDAEVADRQHAPSSP